ncbi:HIT family protein [Streptomyces sp. NPDC059853]|uniref:HIT family protein n=1 Tax=Streptomyces sp. NPDC059853 TaxID=3346973 RepID=UPI0036585D5E
MECVFCRIVRGEAPADRVYEDGSVVAFLDARPLFEGHVLVVPREHLPTLTDLPPELLGPYYAVVRRLAAAVESAMDARGSFVAANNRVSQSVPHFHTHVVPRRPRDGLRGFFWPRGRYRDAERAAEVAALVRAAVSADGAG